ncbi:hypothetical protein DUNSADRAFT_3987 [Dunaliella salina]|uniref:Uncharacterized protein n=1 Tax=Dunaliella salina TaxID=3046 RepID=A0ABQ7GSZ1_DUNSA|nr:hypothetical protein DUNSADRAFT_3987 [Dunaliella salina]|eukprot:KAF5837736.1 hypothetical protein DUNSADRAFT_3987 [Dunaliella salina]
MKFREAGMAFPSGVKDEGKLIKLYIREFHTKALSEHLILFDIRGSLGKCLSRQKEDYPEKLPRAEFLLRQVLDALLRLPKGQDYHTRSRQWMTSVTAQYVEALFVGKKVCSFRRRQREDVNSPDFKRSLEKQHASLRLQSAQDRPAEVTFEHPNCLHRDHPGCQRKASQQQRRRQQQQQQQRSRSSTICSHTV